MNKDSKIYVAGHTGMVGSAICRKLKDRGYKNINWGMHFAPVCTTPGRSMKILAKSNVTNCFDDEKHLFLTRRFPIISCNMLIFKYFGGSRKFVFNHKV